jgi:Glycosyltransferase family 87
MSTFRTIAVGWAVLLLAMSLPNVGLWNPNGKANTGEYSQYGAKIVRGHIPYRSGFYMEFPPGAIPPLALPAVPRSHYVPWFKGFAFVYGIAAVAAVGVALAGTSARRRYGAVVVAGAAPAFLGAIAVNSFDLWPAALATWAVALTVRGRARWGLAFLGAATAAKLFPVLLAPALLTYIVRERGRREATRALLVGGAVLVAIFLPFAVLAPGGLRYSLQQQATRGLQVESLGGSILGVAHRLGAGYRVVVNTTPYSFDFAGRTAGAFATLGSLLVLAATAAAWWLLARRGTVDRDRMFRAAAATAVGFVAFAKVLSPQYLLFLVPLVPLVDSVLAWGVLLLALALTQVWARFPEPFLHMTRLGPGIWAVLARNLVLVALYGILLVGLRHKRSTKSA